MIYFLEFQFQPDEHLYYRIMQEAFADGVTIIAETIVYQCFYRAPIEEK
ncbi:MAG: DUF2887 domain-containing protein [Symploca sp. SIO2E6]|nr:DUF2887 domain-containing protein [Symploca sp. SIO2E6]